MFSTIDLKSSNNKHIRADPSSISKIGSIGKPIQRRSKTGCLTCRKRKKKCDEARPTCDSCQKRGLECDWEIKKFRTDTLKLGAKKYGETKKLDPLTIEDISSVPSDIHHEFEIGVTSNSLQYPRSFSLGEFSLKDISRVENVCEDMFSELSPTDGESEIDTKSYSTIQDLEANLSKFEYLKSNHEYFDENSSTNMNLVETNLLQLDNSPAFESNATKIKVDQFSISSPRNNSSIEDLELKELFGTNHFPLLVQPSSMFNLYLDEAGLLYLGYFENNVATLLSVSPRSSNYFLKTFFTLSITNESVLNALAAWGALFFNGNKSDNSNHEIVNYYLKRSKQLVKKSLLNKFDYFLILAYYLINLGIQICSGDTKNWHNIFNRCWDLLANYGGVQKFIKDFDYSNDCKFLIANLQFHDVMSSETLTNGTRCELSNYNDLFQIKNSLDDEEYGIDPYQGCIQPIVLLLGEIMNRYAEIKGAISTTNLKLNLRSDKTIGEMVDTQMFDEKNYEDLNQIRINHFESIDQSYIELKNKVKYSKPISSQLDQLPNKEEKSKHIKLFELYRMTCKMNLELYFKKVQPNSSEIQTLLLSCFKIMDDLIETNLKGAFNMTLLLCGIACCNHYDRMNLEKKFRKIYSNYKVGNVKRIWDIVKESWQRNINGTTCIDWIDICNDFGWKLSLC